MSEPELEAMARAAERPFRRREFIGHAFAYVVVNAVIVALWAAADGATFWPMWVLAGWGVLLVADAWRTFGPGDVKTRPVSPARLASPVEAIQAP